MTGGRRLIVMRHASAEPYAETDFARRLTARGRAEAAAAGEYLRGVGLAPEQAMVSAAARAVGTWQAVLGALGGQVREQISREMYAAEPETVLECLRLVEAEVGAVMFVGHNPTAAHLAHLLDDGEGDPEALEGLLAGFPAGALAVFELPGAWSELTEASARLTHYRRP